LRSKGLQVGTRGYRQFQRPIEQIDLGKIGFLGVVLAIEPETTGAIGAHERRDSVRRSAVISYPIFQRCNPPACLIREVHDPLRAVLWLGGEIDAEVAGVLEAELEVQHAARRRVVRVDTYGITFIDSAAVDVLVEAHRRWLAMRGTLVLIGVTGPTERLLQLTGLDRELLYMPPAADSILGPSLMAAGSLVASR
jgi:anti-sigma B factor antagonist